MKAAETGKDTEALDTLPTPTYLSPSSAFQQQHGFHMLRVRKEIHRCCAHGCEWRRAAAVLRRAQRRRIARQRVRVAAHLQQIHKAWWTGTGHRHELLRTARQAACMRCCQTIFSEQRPETHSGGQPIYNCKETRSGLLRLPPPGCGQQAAHRERSMEARGRAHRRACAAPRTAAASAARVDAAPRAAGPPRPPARRPRSPRPARDLQAHRRPPPGQGRWRGLLRLEPALQSWLRGALPHRHLQPALLALEPQLQPLRRCPTLQPARLQQGHAAPWLQGRTAAQRLQLRHQRQQHRRLPARPPQRTQGGRAAL